MTTPEYRRTYDAVFRALLSESPAGHYDEMALPSYTHANRAMSWLFWRRIDAAFALAGDLAHKKVLDYGSGGAVTFRHLESMNCEITGYDPEAHDLTRSVADELGITAAILRNMKELSGKTFDCIFALDVLEHVDDFVQTVFQLGNLLRPEGRLVVSGPTENLFYKFGRFLAGFEGHYHHRNIYDIEDTLRGSSFKCLSVKTLYYPIPLFRITSWQLKAP